MKQLAMMLIFLALSLSALADGGDDIPEKVITVVADPWCPYNCSAKSNAPGISIEILKMIFEPYKYKIEYVETEWSKAIAEVSSGQKMVLAATYKQDAPGLLYPAREIYSSAMGFFVQSLNIWKYDNKQSLNDLKKILLIEGYSYGQQLDDLLNQNINIVKRTNSATPLIDNINIVIDGDADAIIDDVNVVNYNLFLMNQINKLKLASDFTPENIYIAFSPKYKDINDIVAIYNAEFQKLAQDGRLNKILMKYGIIISNMPKEAAQK